MWLINVRKMMSGPLRENNCASMFSLSKKMLAVVSILCLMVTMIQATPARAHYQDTNYLEEDRYVPGFLTLGQKYSIAIGSTVVLPCKINETDKTGHYVLAWKRDIAVLTAGNVKVTINPRLRLLPAEELLGPSEATKGSYNLEIRDVKDIDAGDYVCQIGTMKPKEIIHTLEILVPPKIVFIAPPNRLDVSKGATVRLECEATGNPTPKIVWSRKNNVMPNGEPNVTISVLEMMHANRHTAGHYICTADNRVGQPDTREIYVNVLYSPEIEVERELIHTGVGYEAQLTCIVHAEPQPHIIWYKETTQLGTTEQHSQQVRGNRYSLIIRNVTFNDLGNYTCQASNNLGKDRTTLMLSGIPAICTFDSPTLSDHRDRYNISWNVQSYAPIREYRLFYRRQTSSISGSSRNSHTMGHHNKMLENHIMPHVYTSHSSLTHENEWENIVIPEVYQEYYTQSHFQRNPRHRMAHLINSLTPATNYEARVQARNDHGWNKLSSVFHFSTRAEDMEMEPSAQPAVLKTAEIIDKDMTSVSSTHSFKIFTIISALLFIKAFAAFKTQ